jgi:tRNA(Ile)-lysidine synthase
MKQKIKKYIEKETLIEPGAKVIVGVSGGADSMVLWSILRDLGYECLAAHCNFHLRGKESGRDEQFVTDYAAALHLPLFTTGFDTIAIANERKISIEMAARELRYIWFEQLRQAQSAEAVAVAHHCNDNVETLLLNLIRGTGIQGLTGIKPKKEYIVRPLLGVSKADILHYAAANEIPYIVDSSNLTDDYTRNKIRRRLIPLLQSLNPGIETTLLRTINHLDEVSKIYRSHISEAKKQIFDDCNLTLSIPRLLLYPSPESILFEVLKEYGFKKEVIEEIMPALEGQSGKEFFSEEYRLIKDREHLLLVSRQIKEETPVFSIDVTDKEICLPFQMSLEIQEKNKDMEFAKDKKTAYFDMDKLTFPLILRKWQAGDRFIPFGMKGSRKLSDYFNDHKFTKPEKENSWLLCSGQEIIWIVGHRSGERFKVKKSTKSVVIFKLF